MKKDINLIINVYLANMMTLKNTISPSISSVESRMGTITTGAIYGNSALLVLNRTSLNSDSVLLALN